MEVRNCKTCGRLFNYMEGAPLCPRCIKELEEKFLVVKAYIYEHPRAGIQEISEENDVSTQQIKRWVREERLSFTEDSTFGLECESCGKIIKTGKYCQECKDEMTLTLNNMYKEQPKPAPKKDPKESARMRFLDQN